MTGLIRSGQPPIPVLTLQSVAGVLTLDLSLAKYFQVALTENITSVQIINGPPSGYGDSFMLWITQNASAAKTFAMPSFFKWANGSVGVISTALNAVDLLAGSTRDGTNYDVTLSKGRA